jgi:rhodanese-related sulfurtransferase
MEPLEAFLNTILPIESFVRGISPKDTQKACQLGAVILDVRETYNTDFKQFDVPHVLYMPLSKEEELSVLLPEDSWLIIADVSGNMSSALCRRLMNKGMTKLCVLLGGFLEWERLGLPVITDIHQAFSGSCVCQLKQRNLNKK